jgi:hypothetical protein
MGAGAALDAELDRWNSDDLLRVQDAGAIEEIPYALLVRLWEAADRILSPGMADWAEQSGARSIDSLGVKLYGGILQKPTPRDFLTQGVSLFQLFYQPGDMEVVQEEPGHAVTRLVNFDPLTRIFCRRQTGGLGRALELAGGQQATVRHVRCSLEGDAFCEWELRWSAEPARPNS